MAEIQTHSTVVPYASIDGDILTARLHGEIDLHGSPALRDALLEALQKYNPKKLILNLANVPYMDSSAIAVLVEGLQRLRRVGGKLCVTNLQPRVKGLMEIARLDKIFAVAATEDDAKKL